MARISRFKLSDRVYDKLFVFLFELVGKRRNKDDFNRILFDLLSPVERIMVTKRVMIIYLIMKAVDTRTICKVLKVSNGTVCKFRLLMEQSQGIVPALKQLLREEKVILFLKELFNDLFAPGVYGINWSNAWRRKLSLDREKQEGV